MTNRRALGYLLIAPVISAAVLISLSLLIGAFYSEHQMLCLGLALVVGSSVATILVAYRNLASAQRTDGVALEDYVPTPEPKGAAFTSTYGIMGLHPDPLIEVCANVASLRTELSSLRREFDRHNAFIHTRVEILHGLHNYHHEISLPRTMATGMEWLILSAILTILGSVYLAVPHAIYELFNGLAGSIAYLWERLTQSM